MKKTVYFVLTGIVIILVFLGSYQYWLSDIQHWGEEKQTDINNQIKPSKDFIEILTIYGNHYFDGGDLERNQELFALLSYDGAKDTFHTNQIEGMVEQERNGNLVGKGRIPADQAILDEMDLAFSFNPYFYEFSNRLPDIAWIYYMSDSGFLNLFPWVSSEEFNYADELKQLPFYQVAMPEHNPTKEAVWTPIYVDAAGKGQLVTISSPIYKESDFLGVVSIDLTADTFGKVLEGSYDTYLVDKEDRIIADGESPSTEEEEIYTLQNVLKVPDAVMERIATIPSQMISYERGYFIYRAEFDAAPWTLVVAVPFIVVIGKILLILLPILGLCTLLLITLSQIENRKKIEEKLSSIANTDELTGLFNRHYLDLTIEKELERCDRYAQNLSILLLDLDRFKRINDTFGHPVGDDVLIQTAKIIQSLIRKVDVVARIGGEEFLVVLPETDIYGAYKTAEKIRVALDTRVHPKAGRCTASFGIVQREKGESYESIYKKVDEALYLAKKAGRNCIVSYETKENLPIPSVYISWNEAWNSNDEVIDNQHKDLVRSANQLMHLALLNSTYEEMDSQVELLLSRIQSHFDYEEKLQSEIGFPGVEEHRKIHQEMIEQAIKMKETVKDGSIKITDYFDFVVEDVIEGHMLTEDVKFYPFLRVKNS